MSNLNEMELQNLRHLLMFGDNDMEKYQNFAECAQDSQVKQFFQKSVQSQQQNKQTLMQFLS